MSLQRWILIFCVFSQMSYASNNDIRKNNLDTSRTAILLFSVAGFFSLWATNSLLQTAETNLRDKTNPAAPIIPTSAPTEYSLLKPNHNLCNFSWPYFSQWVEQHPKPHKSKMSSFKSIPVVGQWQPCHSPRRVLIATSGAPLETVDVAWLFDRELKRFITPEVHTSTRELRQKFSDYFDSCYKWGFFSKNYIVYNEGKEAIWEITLDFISGKHCHNIKIPGGKPLITAEIALTLTNTVSEFFGTIGIRSSNGSNIDTFISPAKLAVLALAHRAVTPSTNDSILTSVLDATMYHATYTYTDPTPRISLTSIEKAIAEQDLNETAEAQAILAYLKNFAQ